MRGLDNSKPLFEALKNGELNCFLKEIKNNPQDYFLGIRDEYVNIYYMGGNLLKITTSGKSKNNDSFKFEFDKEYLNDKNELLPEQTDINGWFQAIKRLKPYIKSYQEGHNKLRKIKNEKIVQQSILNNINSHQKSEYFITDMEYSCPGIGYGRFDYVAIKKKKESGKHKLALIELKYGTGALGTKFEENNGEESYGSGIVGHAYNFSRFVYGIKENNMFNREKVDKTEYETLEFLRKETVNILRNKSELGLLDTEKNEIFGNLEEGDIDIDSVETLLICVSCKDENKVKNTISKYLGSIEGATYNVKRLKSMGKIADSFKLKCFVTKESNLEYLCENQFVDL